MTAPTFFQSGLHRYAVATAAATFLLLIAGSLVTSHDAGLAVPDWPLSYGTWFPPMVGGILYEHGHRMIAGTVGLMILGLAIWLGRREPRAWVRRLGYAALAAVIVQALLGGLTVLLLLPPQVSIAHASLGQTVWCVVACLASATGPRWEEQPHVSTVSFKASAQTIAALAAGQLLLGAVIRHTGRLVPVHIGLAVALILAALATGVSILRRREVAPVMRRAVTRLWLLLAVQLTAGVLVFFHRAAVPIRTVHVATGALILAQAVVLAWEATRRAPQRAAGLGDYFELTKPRLTGLVLMTTAAGAWMGWAGGSLRHVVDAMLGTWLVAGGANALNEWMEWEFDAQMARTKGRPIPSGRIPPRAARRFGIGLVITGLSLLAAHVNLLATGLAALSAASYLFIYTPLKRRTALCTLAGAIPGALPPMIGWAAVRGRLDLGAWALFWLLFVWQLPHFLAIAMLFRDDYAKAGFRMLPVIESDGGITARQTVLYGLVLVPVSIFPSMIGLAGAWYFYAALLLSAAFLMTAARAALQRSIATAQLLFRSSIAYLPVLLMLLASDRGPK